MIDRIEELELALADACNTISGLADQQAMPDDWYVERLDHYNRVLEHEPQAP